MPVVGASTWRLLNASQTSFVTASHKVVRVYGTSVEVTRLKSLLSFTAVLALVQRIVPTATALVSSSENVCLEGRVRQRI